MTSWSDPAVQTTAWWYALYLAGLLCGLALAGWVAEVLWPQLKRKIGL